MGSLVDALPSGASDELVKIALEAEGKKAEARKAEAETEGKKLVLRASRLRVQGQLVMALDATTDSDEKPLKGEVARMMKANRLKGTIKRQLTEDGKVVTVFHFEGEPLDVNRMKYDLQEFLPGLTDVHFTKTEVLGCPNIYIAKTPDDIRRENSSGDDEREIELASMTSSQLRANTVCVRVCVAILIEFPLFLAIAASQFSRCAGSRLQQETALAHVRRGRHV